MANMQRPPPNGHGLHPPQRPISPSMGQGGPQCPVAVGVGAAGRPGRPPSRLPDRNVAASTIEDAFTNFILYCNPAVPPEADTAALREAFRTPPKSGGKSFSSFTLFELIRQLESKQLKTWAELALKLGVEPPDQEKGQSSQKIQQYAVRLKRWMHSMHVDAFFDYLLDIQHPYWTEIPTDPTPVCEAGRDGVAAEDDMALRALLPQIRPKRGRRKPEDDDLNKSPSQRPRLDSPAGGEEFGQPRHDRLEPWSAHPDGRNPFFFPTDAPKLGAPQIQPHWPQGDMSQTPLTAYPQSAITPSTRAGFWENEPRSAITPSKPKSLGRRHGAKVVSSAWRSGSGSSGKTRGRPPINRPPASATAEGPFSTFPADTPTIQRPSPPSNTSVPFLPTLASGTASPSGTAVPQNVPPESRSALSNPTPPPLTTSQAPTSQTFSTVQAPISAGPSAVEPHLPHQPHQPHLAHQPHPTHPPNRPPARPAKPSRLSLQVPQRPSGSVRLATPPPVVMVNGQDPLAGNGATGSTTSVTSTEPATMQQSVPEHASLNFHHMGMVNTISQQEAHSVFNSQGDTSAASADQLNLRVAPRDPNDATHRVELECYFVDEILQGSWFDGQGLLVPAGTIEEVRAIVDTIIDNLFKAATSKEAFLINLSALAGAKLLMVRPKLNITRTVEHADRTEYTIRWELRYGSTKGMFEVKEVVFLSKWQNQTVPGGDGNKEGGIEREWRRRYQDLMGIVREKDQELENLRIKLRSRELDPRGTQVQVRHNAILKDSTASTSITVSHDDNNNDNMGNENNKTKLWLALINRLRKICRYCRASPQLRRYQQQLQ
ncbi:ARS binding protein 2 [Zalerion maritima]|uniref:ARS binding protein 2 n=1 Tax=Zalerion maritima TaxID=339359 RepID=A0AAD5RYZ7_9PEZI|nr:ARS binding protein 2 [Zalerion maritima]